MHYSSGIRTIVHKMRKYVIKSENVRKKVK